MTISKEIAATGTENEFEIALKVQTSESIEQSAKSPDAAVVLVIDVSGSMRFCSDCGRDFESETIPHHCSKCGKGENDKRHTDRWNSKYHEFVECGTTTRLTEAKKAAKEFLRTYAGFGTDADGKETFKAPGAQRWVAIVAYSNSAATKVQWTNVSAATKEAANVLLDGTSEKYGINDYIDALSANGGTNTDDSLAQVETLLDEETVSKVDNRFVVLLTDGNPNLTRENAPDATTHKNYPTGEDGTAYREYTKADTAATSDDYDVPESYNWPALRANYIRTTQKATLYSVSVGTGSVVSQWLKSISNKCVTATNADQLSLAFKEIIIRMMLAVDAWQVEDVMGSYILLDPVEDSVYDFKDHTQGEGDAPGAVYQSVKTVDGKSVKVLNWDLRKDLMSKSTTIKKNGTILDDKNGYDPSDTKSTYEITYTLKYKVKLDVASLITDVTAANPGKTNAELKALVEAQWNKTNGETRLDYYLTRMNTETKKQEYVKDDGTTVIDVSKGEDPMLHQYFKVPAVKGYAAIPLDFIKKGADGEALIGAKFALSGTGEWSDEAVSLTGGKVTFTNLIPSGDSYTLRETVVPTGYEKVDDVNFTIAYGKGLPTFEKNTVVDPVEIEKDDVSFTKTWYTLTGQDVPESITVDLLRKTGADGEWTTVQANVTVSSTDQANCTVVGNVWTYTFKNLPQNDDKGNPYTYAVEEKNVPNGFRVENNKSLNLMNIANGGVSIPVAKEWILPEKMDESTLPSVTVELIANGTNKVDEATLSYPNWTHTFEANLLDDSGATIEYTVQEAQGSGYQQVKKETAADGTVTFTNTLAQDNDYKVMGQKIWKDGDNEDGNRPASVTLELYKDNVATGRTQVVTAGADGKWSYTFDKLQHYQFLDKDRNETTTPSEIVSVREIVYTVKEVDAPDDYESSSAGTDVINTRTGTVEYTVEKKWTADVTDEHDEVTVILTRNDGETWEKTTENFKCTFDNLPKYDENGSLYRYKATEKPVKGYTPSYKYTDYSAVITNKPNISDDETAVTVTKHWQQPDGTPTQSATFKLYDEDDMNTVINFWTIKGDQTYSFEKLPKYKAVNGKLEKINYVVEEDAVDGYKTEVKRDKDNENAWTFTNTITGQTTLTVSKSWVDPDSTARPGAIKVNVLRLNPDNGKWLTLAGKTITIDVAGGETQGEVTLSKYDDKGRVITYMVQERSVNGYSPAVTGGVQEDGSFVFEIENTINQVQGTVTVSKTWIDGGTAPADRPDVTLQVLQDNNPYETVTFYYDETAGAVKAKDSENGELTVTVDGNTYSVNLLADVYTDSKTEKHVYTATENTVPTGYVSSVSGTSVTNRREGVQSPMTITKWWTDPAGTTDRPAITLVLKGSDGSKIEITADDDNGGTVSRGTIVIDGNAWRITLSDLPEFDKDGAKITYTLDEKPVDGYTAKEIDQTTKSIRNVINQKSDISAGATKEWANMDADGHYKAAYPDSITVALFRDGQMVDGSKQTVNRTDSNTYPIETYNKLDKYAPDGHVYKYEVLELDANGAPVKDGGTVSFGENNEYTVTYSNRVITNTFKVPAKYLYVVECHYIHKDYDGTQIFASTATYGPKAETESKIITVDPDDYKVCEKDGLTYKFDEKNTSNKLSVELKKENYVEKLVLNYILVEKAPEEPIIPPKGDSSFTLNVQKVWKGDNAEDRPESITVQLLKDGKAYSTLELSASKNWKGRWVDLSDKYNWTVEELDVPDGYSSEVSVRNNTWTITNTYDGGSVIPEEPVPGGDQPAIPGGDGDGEIIIPDTDVPTGDKTTNPPKTGDAMGLWAAMAALSGAGLGWVTLSNKKRKDEEA